MFGLDDRETGIPVVAMTQTTYWARWALAGLIAFALARYFLVQPILDAILSLKHV
jgi:hypothetical protein